MVGFFLLKKKKVNYEKPIDIDSLPNADAVRDRINDFGTARRDNGGHDSGDVSSAGGVQPGSPRRRNPGILTRWVESSKRMGDGGTHPVMRVRHSGSTEGADDTD